MAKQVEGYLGGFRGKLGPAVGYEWNGVWCVRSRPGMVRNPRTEAQQQHREMFKQEVQLAATMRQALVKGLGYEARPKHMTPQNLFVKANQPAFSLENNQLVVDYARLVLSAGPVAPVAFNAPEITEDHVLKISFEKNPLHVRADVFDCVYLYVYCPEMEEGYLTAPVYRMDKRISVVLPSGYLGKEVYLYGFVQDEQGRCSETIYIGCGVLGETGTLGSQKDLVDLETPREDAQPAVSGKNSQPQAKEQPGKTTASKKLTPL